MIKRSNCIAFPGDKPSYLFDDANLKDFPKASFKQNRNENMQFVANQNFASKSFSKERRNTTPLLNKNAPKVKLLIKQPFRQRNPQTPTITITSMNSTSSMQTLKQENNKENKINQEKLPALFEPLIIRKQLSFVNDL